ncbi:MAG TPA: hypothetical protein VGI39_07690 [Polyangiaceae bacterium]
MIAVSLSACSGQGEGQRCDVRDDSESPPGSSDCASGLVCDTGAPGIAGYSSTSTQAGKSFFGLCCPPSRANATTAACGAGTTIGNNGFPEAGTDATAGGSDASSGDAASDGATNEAGGSDAANDGAAPDAGEADAGSASDGSTDASGD